MFACKEVTMFRIVFSLCMIAVMVVAAVGVASSLGVTPGQVMALRLPFDLAP